MTGFSRMLFPVLAIAGLACLSLPVFAQDTDDEDYKPVLPDVGIYKAMLDANKQTGWIQFRNYDDKQLIYFHGAADHALPPLGNPLFDQFRRARQALSAGHLQSADPLQPAGQRYQRIYLHFTAGRRGKDARHPGRLGRWRPAARLSSTNPAKALGTQPARRSRRSSGRRNRCRNRWRLIRRSAPCNRKHRERRSWRRQPHRQPALRFARRPLVAAHSASR